MSRRTLAAIVGLLAGLVAMQATANAASLYTGPARGRARTSSTRRPPPRRSSRTPASGRPRRSWSPARAPTATASSSTRTSSTTTTARTRRRDPADPRAAGDTVLEAERHLHLPDRPRLREQRRRPRRAARQAARRRDRLPRHAQHAEGPVAGRLHDRDRRHGRRTLAVPARRERERARRPLPDRAPGGTGMVAELADAATGAAGRGRAPTVTVDTHAPPDRGARAARARGTPDRQTVRLAAGVGLWDTADEPLPRARSRPPTRPTPAAPAPPPARRRSSTSPSAPTSRCP